MTDLVRPNVFVTGSQAFEFFRIHTSVYFLPFEVHVKRNYFSYILKVIYFKVKIPNFYRP